MWHHDPGFLDQIEQAVQTIESTTDAEIVVVVASASGDYPGLHAFLAGMWSMIIGVVLILVPFTITPIDLLISLFLSFWMAWYLLDLPKARPQWISIFSRYRRFAVTQHRAVLRRAREEFVLEAVHGTPNRSGVLVLVSAAEAKVVVIGDLGVQGEVPEGELALAQRRFDAMTRDDFLAGLHELGRVLSIHLPHGPESDDVDLPNAPRVKP